ncbi:MAG: hypothetical protein OHK0018_13270 [Erythrobacter tepidarius]
MRGKIGTAETPARLTDHAGALGSGDRFGQGIHAQPRGGDKALVLRSAAMDPILAEQVEQLPILRAQAPLTRGALAQHGGKAVIEKQAGTPETWPEFWFNRRCAVRIGGGFCLRLPLSSATSLP